MTLHAGLNRFFDNMLRTQQAREKEKIAEDPTANKLTCMMADGKPASYRYVAATNGRGMAVRFCWSCHRNAAGYFLGWRETHSSFKHARKSGVYATRDQWSVRKVKKRV